MKVSLRSVGNVDVAEFAHRFGGGGHSRAAGVALHGTLAEVQEKILAGSEEFPAKVESKR